MIYKFNLFDLWTIMNELNHRRVPKQGSKRDVMEKLILSRGIRPDEVSHFLGCNCGGNWWSPLDCPWLFCRSDHFWCPWNHLKSCCDVTVAGCCLVGGVLGHFQLTKDDGLKEFRRSASAKVPLKDQKTEEMAKWHHMATLCEWALSRCLSVTYTCTAKWIYTHTHIYIYVHTHTHIHTL